MLENYVKFRRGYISDYEKLTLEQKESDTLYFLYKDDNSTEAELYLGTKKISTGINGGGESGSVQALRELTDVLLSENISPDDLLVYNGEKWVNKSLEEIFSPTVKIVTNNDNHNLHADLIDEAFAQEIPKNGDIVIIKDFVGDNCRHVTSYIFNNNNWNAMNGNYDANNIYFNEDFIFTENIGTVTVPEIGNLTVEAQGKSLKEFLSSIFASEKNPEVELPSASIVLGMSNSVYEVGTSYSPYYQITFNDGNYSYGPNPTGVVATFNVSDGVNVSTNSSGNFNSFEIKDDTNYKISATVSYTEGAIPKTNLGNNCEEAKIPSGELSIESTVISGYRKSFYGALNNKEDYNIRDLKSSTNALKDGSSFTINLSSTTKRVVIAYPATLRDLTSVLDKNDSNSNIVSGFGEPEIKQIQGASKESSAIDYKVYTMDFANEYGTSNVFTVTI